MSVVWLHIHLSLDVGVDVGALVADHANSEQDAQDHRDKGNESQKSEADVGNGGSTFLFFLLISRDIGVSLVGSNWIRLLNIGG